MAPMFDVLGHLAGKVEWEGGLYETAYGYGLRHTDINPHALPELYDAWKAMDEAHEQHFKPAYERVEALLFPSS